MTKFKDTEVLYSAYISILNSANFYFTGIVEEEELIIFILSI